MRILVTGFAGFIGSNLVRMLIDRFPNDEIVGLDAYTYAARPAWALSKAMSHERHFMAVKGDVSKPEETLLFIERCKPDLVFHLAAETHVCNSIEGPRAFIESNAVGTWALLEACRQVWAGDKQKIFVHVSTDEVYGELEPNDPPFSLYTPYRPRSPYAASKAAADHFVQSYHHTYGLNTRITNCTNNFGPNQHEEKLIPRAIQKMLSGQPMTVYGNGQQIRDWLWVEDHCEAMIKVAMAGEPGGKYLIGGENEMTNLEVLERVAKAVNEVALTDIELNLEFTNGRPTDDKRYAVDTSEMRILGWEPKWKSQMHPLLCVTAQWYLERMKEGGGSA